MAARDYATEAMDSDSEDEIFFGPVTAKEEVIAAPLRNRKTEIYDPRTSRLYRRSSVPSLESLEEEELRTYDADIGTIQPEIIDIKEVYMKCSSVVDVEGNSFVQEPIKSHILEEQSVPTEITLSSDDGITVDMEGLSLDKQVSEIQSSAEAEVALTAHDFSDKSENLDTDVMIRDDSYTCLTDLEVHYPDSSALQSLCSSSDDKVEQFDSGSVDLQGTHFEGDIVTCAFELQEGYGNANSSDLLSLCSQNSSEKVDIVKAAMEVLYLDNGADELKLVTEQTTCGTDFGSPQPFCMLDTIKGYAKENDLEVSSCNVSAAASGNADLFLSSSPSVQDNMGDTINGYVDEDILEVPTCNVSAAASTNIDLLPSSSPSDQDSTEDMIKSYTRVNDFEVSSCNASAAASVSTDLVSSVSTDLYPSSSLSGQDNMEVIESKALDTKPQKVEMGYPACASEEQECYRDLSVPQSFCTEDKKIEFDGTVCDSLSNISKDLSPTQESGSGSSVCIRSGVKRTTSQLICPESNLSNVDADVDWDTLTNSLRDGSHEIESRIKSSFSKEKHSIDKCVATLQTTCSEKVIENYFIGTENHSILTYELDDNSLLSDLGKQYFTKKRESESENLMEGENSGHGFQVISSNNSSSGSKCQSLHDISEQIDSSEGSSGIANKGLIFSQTPNLDSCSVSSNEFYSSHSNVKSDVSKSGYCPSADSSECPETRPAVQNIEYYLAREGVVVAKGLEANSISMHQDTTVEANSSSMLQNTPAEDNSSSMLPNTPTKSDNFRMEESCDESSSENDSPKRRFNDTIEEMEMLLKYGLNYGEESPKSKDACSSDTATEEAVTRKLSIDDDYDDANNESIISPRKSSVMSSVSNFDPEFNSTQVVSFLKEQSQTLKSGQEGKEDMNRLLHGPSKAVPPPKPPRNVNAVSGSPARAVTKNSTPKDLHLGSTPIKSQLPKESRKDTPIPKVGIKKTTLTTPRSAVISRIKPNMFRSKSDTKTSVKTPGVTPKFDSKRLIKTPSVTPKNEVKRLIKAPNTVSGATRSVSMTNTPRERQMSTPSCTTPRFQPQSVLTPKRLTPTSQQKRPVAVEKHMVIHGLPPRPTPSNQTMRLVKKDKGLLIKKHLRQGGLDIVSPVAQYLRENPPPSLIVNVKPRQKLQEDAGNTSPRLGDKPSVRTPTHGVASKQSKTSRVTPVLPVAMYSPALPIVLDDAENKENERLRNRQEISSGTLPAYVIKHKGRVKLPKKVVKEECEISSPSGLIKSAVPSRMTTSSRSSLMEVSLYESHKTQYSNTLK